MKYFSNPIIKYHTIIGIARRHGTKENDKYVAV